jgi:hypothetical protein
VRAGKNSQLAVGRPLSRPLRQELLGDAAAEWRQCPLPACYRYGRSTGDARHAEEDDATGGLIWVLLQPPVDHEATQAVSDQMERPRRQLPYELLQARGGVRDGRHHTPVVERMNRKPQPLLQPAAQEQRFRAVHPESMHIDKVCRAVAAHASACSPKPLCSRIPGAGAVNPTAV